MDILALHLRHVAQQLQHNIGNQGVGHIRRAAGPDARVKQWHVQHHNGNPELLGNASPFLKNLGVITAKSVDRKHHQHVPVSQDVQQLAIPRAVEVLAARMVGINIRRAHAIGAQRIQLPIKILIARTHPRITIHRRHLIPAFL